MSAKEIRSGEFARNSVISGFTEAADAAAVTLGRCGRNVIIERSYGAPKVTKDGISVIKEIEFKDRFKNIGAQMLKEASDKTNSTAGDGTTSTAVIAREMVREGHKAIAAGRQATYIQSGINKAIEEIITQIKNVSKPISSTEEIAQVATISANGDRDIGQKIAEAFEKVGKDGVVTVEEANKSDSFEAEIVEGMHFDRGYLSPYFVTNSEKMICEFEKPYILLVEKKVSNLQQLLPVLEQVVQSGKPLLIIAEDVEGEALATLIVNKLRGGLKVAAVKAPGFGDRRKAMLEDIAIVTGGTVISEDLGHKLENTTLENLGTANKVIISKDDTTIVNGAGGKSGIEARCNEIRAQIEETSSDYDKEKLEERLAKLAGGIAVLKVGGITEVEVKEKKDRVEDAYHATKAAIAEGIVAGGGCTLLYAAKALDSVKTDNDDEAAGVNIVRKALEAPVRQIIANAGLDGSLIVAKLQEGNDSNKIYDAEKKNFVDAFKSGIIDPTKVVRTALQSAGSVAGLLLTTEAVIADKASEGDNDNASSGGGMPAGAMGGMPGMGGMGGMGGF
jgi:chaperonin GroEL